MKRMDALSDTTVTVRSMWKSRAHAAGLQCLKSRYCCHKRSSWLLLSWQHLQSILVNRTNPLTSTNTHVEANTHTCLKYRDLRVVICKDWGGQGLLFSNRWGDGVFECFVSVTLLFFKWQKKVSLDDAVSSGLIVSALLSYQSVSWGCRLCRTHAIKPAPRGHRLINAMPKA